MRKSILITLLCSATVFYFSCSKADDGLTDSGAGSNDTTQNDNSGNDDTSNDTSSTSNTGLQALMSQFFNDVNVYIDGDYIVIEAAGVPDHKSPYWGSGHASYEDYSGDNPDFFLNPNKISNQNYTFRIPKNPSEASNHEATPMGPMGVSLNGVAFYNQNAAPGDDLSQEINSFDHHNGHPTHTGSYHYHIEPLWLTKTIASEDAFLGFLLDGFPVYGPVDYDGTRLTSSDLDDYHGHFGPTKEFPNGIYHYHITDDDPYINGDGFFGTAGTVSR